MRVLKNFALLPVFLASLVSAIVILATPHFCEMFISFGAELPKITQLLLAGYWAWVALPIFAILSVKFTEKGSQLRANAAFASIILSVFAMSVFVLAVYSPLFLLGATGP